MIKQRKGFPQAYKNYPTELLLDVYSKGYIRLLKAIDDLSYAEMKLELIPNKWTIYQILIHIVDSELMGYGRFTQTITQSDNSFAHYDQDVWAQKLDYNLYPETELQNRLKLFDSIRKSVYFLLMRLSKDDWNKLGIHYQHGEMTLRNLLELYADHSERHISQIVERRKLLGKFIDIKPLIPERLY